MATNDGGPAFPQTYRIPGCSTVVGASGLSLRDYFAAAALTGLIMSQTDKAASIMEQAENGDLYGPAAYKIADAMMAARTPN